MGLQQTLGKLTTLDWHIIHQQPTKDGVAKILDGLPGDYKITKSLPFSHDCFASIIAECLAKSHPQHADKTTRILVLMGKHQEAFAEMVRSITSGKMLTEKCKQEQACIDVLDKAHGTALFFTDLSPVALQVLEDSASPPTFVKPNKKKAEDAIKRQQYHIWTALKREGVGASLQHYKNIEKQVAARWAIPKSWKLKGKLVFGAMEKQKSRPIITQKEAKEKLMIFPPIKGFANGQEIEVCAEASSSASAAPAGLSSKSSGWLKVQKSKADQ